jgi:hypothetical protein
MLLVWNEMTSECVMASSVTIISSDKQDNHEMFIHRNWFEVDPKYSSKKQNTSLIKQYIPALNSYAPLINLQVPVINTKSDAVVVKELGLPYDIERRISD